MATTREFQSKNQTHLTAAKQPLQNVMFRYLKLQDLSHFMLTSVECYELAIAAFQKQTINIFMKMVMIRNDDVVKAMLEYNPWLFAVSPDAMDYSFRKFAVPAFTYYLFTWDKRGMEVMLEAVALCAQHQKNKNDVAKKLIGELLTQLQQWRLHNVKYQLADKQYQAQYYNPTSLCKAMQYYETKCEGWSKKQCDDYVKKTLCHLQWLMPVGLIYQLGETMKNQPQRINHEEDKFQNPTYAVIDSMRYMTIYPVNKKFDNYVILNGGVAPSAFEQPTGEMVKDTRESIEYKYSKREEVIAEMEKKLKNIQENPATLFKKAKVKPEKTLDELLKPKRKKILGIF